MSQFALVASLENLPFWGCPGISGGRYRRPAAV